MTAYVKTITEQPDRIVITAEDTAGKQVNVVLSKELAKQLLDALFFAQTENHAEIPLPERKGQEGALLQENRHDSEADQKLIEASVSAINELMGEIAAGGALEGKKYHLKASEPPDFKIQTFDEWRRSRAEKEAERLMWQIQREPNHEFKAMLQEKYDKLYK